MPAPRVGPSGGGGGGGTRPQIPGQNPSALARQIKQLFDALGAQGMNPQSAPQTPPAQMDPSSTVDAMSKASRLQNLGTQLGTYTPSVWAQQRGITGPAPTNVFANQTQDALAPLLKSQMGVQNQNQLIDFGNTQAQAQTSARNQGIAGAQGAVGAQAQGGLQMLLANILSNSKFNKPMGTTEQARLSTLQSLVDHLNNVDQIREKYQGNVGSLLKYAGGLGYIDRLQLMVQGKSNDQINEMASDAQQYSAGIQGLKLGHRALVPGRTLAGKEGDTWAAAVVPGMDPAETNAGYSGKRESYRSMVETAMNLINNPRRDQDRGDNLGVSPMPAPPRVNRGTGETQDADSAPIAPPSYGTGVSQSGDMGGDATAPKPNDKSQGVPRPQRRATVQRLIQKYQK